MFTGVSYLQERFVCLCRFICVFLFLFGLCVCVFRLSSDSFVQICFSMRNVRREVNDFQIVFHSLFQFEQIVWVYDCGTEVKIVRLEERYSNLGLCRHAPLRSLMGRQSLCVFMLLNKLRNYFQRLLLIKWATGELWVHGKWLSVLSVSDKPWRWSGNCCGKVNHSHTHTYTYTHRPVYVVFKVWLTVNIDVNLVL